MIARTCCVCFDEEPSGGIMCSGDPTHLVCSSCLEPLVKTKVEELRATGDDDGFIFCPLHGRHGCTSQAPFTGLAQTVSGETFNKYLEGRSARRLAEAERKAYADAHQIMQDEMKALKSVSSAATARGSRLLAKQLQRTMPDARQCPACSHGPIDHRDCEDLAAHHGQVLAGGFKIDNSCPKCGFFSQDKADWPLWDGTLADEGSEAVVDAATAERLVEAEVRDAQERQELAERKAEEALRSRRAVAAHARGVRSSLLESINEETHRRKKEHQLRKRAEAEAAEERERRKALEMALSRLTPLQATATTTSIVGKPGGRTPAQGHGKGAVRPISAPSSRRAMPPPASLQPTGGAEVGDADDWLPGPCHRSRPISAPVALRPTRLNGKPLAGVGSLQAALREARREAL